MTDTVAQGTPATLHYGDGEFLVLKGGSFVRCAITQQQIPLTTLRYWSVERQEPYASPLEYLAASTGQY